MIKIQFMNERGQIFKKIILTIYLIALHILAGSFVFNFVRNNYFSDTEVSYESVKVPTDEKPVPSPLPEEPSFDEYENSNAQVVESTNANVNQNAELPQRESSNILMIPVAGIKHEQLTNTFNAARGSGSRVHDAIDIMAAGGTPVVATADGEIAKFFDSVPGGITIYQYSSDKKYVYYYAHLERRAENIKEKDFVKQGTIIGYVGDTGNAGAGNYHLHFSIAVLDESKSYWKGTYINPYPLLKNGITAP